MRNTREGKGWGQKERNRTERTKLDKGEIRQQCGWMGQAVPSKAVPPLTNVFVTVTVTCSRQPWATNRSHREETSLDPSTNTTEKTKKKGKAE